MERDQWLSELVEEFISDHDHSGWLEMSAEERAETQKTRAIVEIIMNDIVASRETLKDNSLRGLERLVEAERELVRYFLDDRFTRDVITAVPGYVQRMLKLSRLEASTLPSNVTNGYLREAVRTYILGLPQASVALSRAALEQALKEKLGFQLSGNFITFQKLLDEARKWNVLDRTMELCARDVANAGDDVMHEKPTTLDNALDVLDKLRGLLQHVYSLEGHF